MKRTKSLALLRLDKNTMNWVQTGKIMNALRLQAKTHSAAVDERCRKKTCAKCSAATLSQISSRAFLEERVNSGLVLHLATSAISASADEGQSWTHFELAPATAWQGWCGPGTPYYPKAVHLPNGEILVLGHVGGDNGYGTIDQAIVGMRFRLEP